MSFLTGHFEFEGNRNQCVRFMGIFFFYQNELFLGNKNLKILKVLLPLPPMISCHLYTGIMTPLGMSCNPN